MQLRAPAPPAEGDETGSVIRRILQRLADLERPSGTQVGSLVAQVKSALANINSTVAAAIAANSYTRAQVDSKIASPGNVSPGNVSASGTITAAGAMSAPGLTASGTVDANVLKTRSGPTTNITAARVAGWLQSSDGTVGTASSSERFKTNIRPARIDVAAVLGIEVDLYQYLAEIEKRDDPRSENYEGANYPVATEIGVIAERLHEAGLWQFVVYERDEHGRTIRNAQGQPTPFSVHYHLLALALLPVAQHQAAQINALTARLDALEARRDPDE